MNVVVFETVDLGPKRSNCRVYVTYLTELAIEVDNSMATAVVLVGFTRIRSKVKDQIFKVVSLYT